MNMRMDLYHPLAITLMTVKFVSEISSWNKFLLPGGHPMIGMDKKREAKTKRILKKILKI
jgi:hypothetical protein